MATLARLRPPFKGAITRLLNWAVANGYRPRVTSAYRSKADQSRLYRAYLAGRNPYPVAPPGSSLHEYGLAVDIVSEDNEFLGAVWRAMGGFWDASDDVHFALYPSVRSIPKR